MKLTFVVATVLFLSFQSQANQACRIIFNVPSNVSKTQQVENEAGQAIQSLSQSLPYFYNVLQRATHNRDANQMIGVIVEANNDLLETISWLHSKKSLFASRSERERFQNLLNPLRALLVSQGFSEQLIDKVIEIRLSRAEEARAESERPRGTIGFLAAKENAKAAVEAPRTIGFLKTPVLENPYGRKQVAESEKSQGLRIGFIHSQAEEKVESKPMNSIGFTASDANVDVSYRLSIGFNGKSGFFIPVREEGVIGFISAK